MQSSWNCRQLREIVVSPIPDGGLLGDGSGQPVLEGFSDSQVDRNRPRADHQIFVLQAAKRGLWRALLGRLTSLCYLVLGGRLRLRSLQLYLRESWDFVDESVLVEWTDMIRSDLLWWSDARNILVRVSLATPHMDHHFWSNASDQGWGAHVDDQLISGWWSQEEMEMSINLWELRTIRLGLQHFQCLLAGSSVGVFADNTTVLAFVRKQGGTHSRLLNEEAQLLLRWADKQQILLLPQFVIGTHNMVANSLSRPNEVIRSEWTLAQEVVDHLVCRWPATINLFAIALNHRLPLYFAPMADPVSGCQVLNKFLESTNCELTLVAPWWPQQEWFPDLQHLARFPPIPLTFFGNLISIITISIRGCRVFTRGDCKTLCTRMGCVWCCGASVGQLSSAFVTAIISTSLVSL